MLLVTKLRNRIFDEISKKYPRLAKDKDEFLQLVDTIAFYKARWLLEGKDKEKEFKNLMDVLTTRYRANKERKEWNFRCYANILIPDYSDTISEKYREMIYAVFVLEDK